MKYLVSIIIPCYNQAQYLEEALQSVFDQTYVQWECIIVNDGSPDNTEIIAKEWIIKDNRFKYLSQENGGVSSARNLGISNSNGEFILPLDADDKISKDYIDLAISAFKENSSLKLVYCKAEKFGDEVGLWNLNFFSLYNLSIKNVIFCSALFRKNDWELVGGYDVNMTHGVEDWEFWIALLKEGGQVKCLDSIGFYYRVKKVSRQKLFDDNKYNYSINYISIKHADFFLKQHGNSIRLYRENIELKKFHLKVVSSFVYKVYKFLMFLYEKVNKIFY
ncbi:glycosyltransferase family A protein [Flavobacterium granuli]|uniref:Glycosyltransferase involved in cell wall biosynthesis n=1 Tax=Flavobacterium granuli TaxID=280093 RepID=A0ABU1S5Y9_9FLAO|nr:glycosyltransferase family A protein [Flavobacterium granuli]MDR6846418.1 glycosyltransferase involved in cell wall biosynthesis [Flavobacterium granuli]